MSRLLLLQHDSIFARYGGVQYYLHDLCALSSELLGEENFLSLIPSRKLPRNEPAPYRFELVPYPSSTVLSKLYNRIPFSLIAAARRSLGAKRADLLLCSHVSLAPVGYWLSKLYGIPYAVVVYGTDCWGDLWAQDEWSLRRASHLFSISDWTKSILVKRGYLANRIHIVHPRMYEGFESLSTRVPRESGRFEMLCVARLDSGEQYKGQDHVLEALRRVRTASPRLDFRFTIVGDGDDRVRLERLAGLLQLQDRVRFLPAVGTRDQLTQLYRESDLYVMPSRFGKWQGEWRGEGFGIVYVEAAAFSVPSVAYRCGGVMDIVTDQKTGWLVEPDSVSDLALQLGELIGDRARVHKAGERAREHVLRKFTRAAVRAEMDRALGKSFSPETSGLIRKNQTVFFSTT
ncbi:MAG: glycosyltransferase family 4 protein [Bdellovibrionales bacterium]|nr:glycosyltransferase family 4 protein [Bdellovibrionales bacterium]